MVSLQLYLLLLCAVACERAAELAISARNARRALARGGIESGRGHLRAMMALHALFLPACFAEAWALRRPFPGTWGLLALAGALAAQGLRWWAVRTLGGRWSVRVITVPGEAPVTWGPYRLLRHPNYLAVGLELFCLPLVHGAFLCALVFSSANAVLLRVRIRAEERALGPAWERAFAGVPRLWPGGGRG